MFRWALPARPRGLRPAAAAEAGRLFRVVGEPLHWWATAARRRSPCPVLILTPCVHAVPDSTAGQPGTPAPTPYPLLPLSLTRPAAACRQAASQFTIVIALSLTVSLHDLVPTLQLYGPSDRLGAPMPDPSKRAMPGGWLGGQGAPSQMLLVSLCTGR